VLDPKTSEPLPRTGVQTGRHACFDLLAETYWAGTITGDEVTAHWDEDCPCGRLGVFFDGDIHRYGEAEGGDDKITCARTPDAYGNLVDFALSGADTWCRANPEADNVPAFATGHGSAFTFRCHAGKAEVSGKTFPLDSRGFAASLWTPLD